MHRYYMTPETRQALIAESNRLIAVRAAMQVARTRREQNDANARDEDSSFAPHTGAESETSSESAFARLVADLQSTAPSGYRPASAG
jgi:hypothetical protein